MTRRSFARAAAAVALVFALSLALRWEAINYSGYYNPDEAEILAAGRRAAMQLWLPMGTSSANTYYVLWPMSLGSLDSLGVPLTLRIAHLLSACSYAALISMVWVATARRWGWLWPAIFILPPAYWLLAIYADFTQLGTELPSVLLLTAGALVAFRPNTVISARRLAVVAAVASLAPWFKPQSGPLAVVLVISACCFAYVSRDDTWTRREWTRRGAALAAGGLGPTVLLVAVMVGGGSIDRFWDEPIGFLLAYLRRDVEGLGLVVSTPTMGHKLGELLPLVALNFVAFSWALMSVRGLRLGDSRSSTHKALCAAIWVMPIVAALGTLVVLYPVYVHYLNFLYGGTAIAAIAGAGLDALPDGEEARAPLMRGVRDRVVEVAALVVLAIALGTHFVLQGPQVVGPPTHQDNATLTALCPAEKPVFVWGWAAELYSYYDWQPASRYVTFALLVAETPNRESYRLRFLEEMATRPPSCIVEAIGPTWFLGAGHNQLADEIPASRAWLEECYRKVTVTFEETEDQVSVWALEPDCRASR